jgi:hypothetical protein
MRYDGGDGDGTWTWEPFWNERSALIDDYNDLARRWNKYLPVINGRAAVGRPLAASEAPAAAAVGAHRANAILQSPTAKRRRR